MYSYVRSDSLHERRLFSLSQIEISFCLSSTRRVSQRKQ